MRIEPRDRDEAVVLVAVAAVHSKRTVMVAFSFSLFIFLSFLTQPSSSLAVNLNFDTNIDLFGDAHTAGDGVSLTRRSPSTSGLLLRRDPITFSTSISAEFSFSISSDDGDGLVLVLVPGHFSTAFPGNGPFGLSQNVNNNYIAVEFDTSKNNGVNDPNANHVGIDVGSLISVALANVSDSNLVLNNGEKLKAWVDYVAGSKKLEVRLCKLREKRPSNPIVSYPIDLVKFWGGERVFVGLGSSNGVHSVQVVSVFSWKVRLGSQQHSEPADPNLEGHVAADQRKGGYGPLSILAAVIFGTGCVTLVSFVVLFMWAIFFQRREEETLGKMSDHPVDHVRYERIDVAVDKNNVVVADEN